LYESPSGLVIYWILNNLFSLAKNVIQKMKHPKTVLSYIIGITLILAAAILLAMPKKTVFYKKIIIAIAGVIFCCLPTIINRLKQSAKFDFLNAKTETKSSKTDFLMFIFSALAMSLLLGLLLPSSVIASSPTEFSFLGKTDSPFSYIYSTFWTFLGLCTLWPTIIYLMFGHKVRRVLSAIMPSLLICVLCNVYIFKPNYGNLNSIFEISFVKRNFKIPAIQHILSVILLPLIVCLVFILRKIKKHNYLSVLMLSVCIAIASLSAVKCHFIKTEYKNYAERRLNNEEQKTTISPIYHLSKDNENVIILFLDRAIGAFFPYIIKEFPELKEKFSGFTFYPNTLSFGLHTNSGFPAMAGGYEYTPDKINERGSEKLVDKHNEACMVMPKIFLDAGYDVTVTDVPWLGYQWVPDIDVFRQHGINANNVDGQYAYLYKKQQNIIEEDFQTDEVCRDKIKFFVMTQAILPAFRKSVYESGNIDMDKKADTNRWTDSYAQLHFLPELTGYDNKNKTFTFICNDAPHQDTLLDAPNYKKPVVESNPDYTPSFTSDNMETTQAYHVNISAIMAVGAWLDSLRANNVYNNSRIIIVSDHGYNHKLYQDFPLFVNSEISLELPCFANPLLMYKDFNENGELVTDYSFMTNADTIILARQNLSVSDKNPFTGKTIQPDKANGVNCYDDIIPWDASNQRKLNKFPLDPSKGWVVRDNLFDPNNWTKLSHSK
ncbi:MAG: sulfatase-like hydrolase/transferase, partial [Spirochaetales bacterium]|nr:sulfatase-like hydrolase/transferase [Spirochaetales bacterium]